MAYMTEFINRFYNPPELNKKNYGTYFAKLNVNRTVLTPFRARFRIKIQSWGAKKRQRGPTSGPPTNRVTMD